MPGLASPWFHQRNPLAAQAAAAVQSGPDDNNLSEADVNQITSRVSKPTTASRAKVSSSWKLDNTFMDNGRHSWSKMGLFADCKRCMWNDSGTVKTTCKIRPITNSTPR